ncbi:MAG: flagellar motor switch protein FliG [Silicimonas sp.]|nr:flagellar motor switch protein FliG [Silicimonas sp.]
MPVDMNLAELPGDMPMMDNPAARLNSREKAAIVVRLLLTYGAVPALTELSETKQTELAVQLAKMTPVDQDTVAAVATEFADEIERIGLSFPTGLDGALGMLDGVISEGATARLQQMNPSGYRGNPWDTVSAAESSRLLPYLESESVEVAAVILSKLDVGKAAEILGKLPGERSRRITYAISQTGQVSPGVVQRIGISLSEELERRPVTAFDDGPVKRVGNILNYTQSSIRDEVLSGLDEDDKEFADDVRAAIFTFANIAERISPRDIPRVQRDLDLDDLATITAGAKGNDEASINFILENISKRMAEGIRDDSKEKKDLAPEDVEDAMLRVVSKIRELEAQGEIFFVTND